MDDIDYLGARRMVARLLWRAVADARKGDAAAGEWLAGDDARWWAEMLDLEWPPAGLRLAIGK